jgi:DNA adenine methylase
MPFYTPLRYPGGKRKLSNFFKVVIKQNGLTNGHYMELYAGGAAVAIELLLEAYISHIYINDLDRAIYAFWHTVLYETEKLCKRIQEIDVTMEEWYHQKEIQEQSSNAHLFDLGFSTFFLNRTNRSGIILGGVIGGKAQKGTYKIDERFNKSNLIQRIKRIASYRNQITLYNRDSADLIKNALVMLPQKTLIYLDPPYYSKGKGLYKNFYKHQDHEQVARLITNTDRKWVVTYDNTSEIKGMYTNCKSIIYGLHYSAADRYQGSEVMFLSNDLKLPQIENPAKVSKQTVRKNDEVQLNLSL